jgi:hypothetical protein
MLLLYLLETFGDRIIIKHKIYRPLLCKTKYFEIKYFFSLNAAVLLITQTGENPSQNSTQVARITSSRTAAV